jgi:hypothetical protein
MLQTYSSISSINQHPQLCEAPNHKSTLNPPENVQKENKCIYSTNSGIERGTNQDSYRKFRLVEHETMFRLLVLERSFTRVLTNSILCPQITLTRNIHQKQIKYNLRASTPQMRERATKMRRTVSDLMVCPNQGVVGGSAHRRS